MSTERPEEERKKQLNRQLPNITTFSRREPMNFSRTREGNNKPTCNSNNNSLIGNLALTSSTTHFTMVNDI